MPLDTQELLVALAEWRRTHVFGVYRGKVSTVGSGDQLGFLRVLIPEIYGADLESPWAEPAMPFAGPGYGLLTIPRVDDYVWIAFVGADRNRPVYLGSVWARKDELPEQDDAERQMWQTPAGHRLLFDDDAGEIRIEHSSGAAITVSDQSIVLESGGSAGKVEITSSGVTINGNHLEVT